MSFFDEINNYLIVNSIKSLEIKQQARYQHMTV